MRENRPSGSEGGAGANPPVPTPISSSADIPVGIREKCEVLPNPNLESLEMPPPHWRGPEAGADQA